MHDSPFFLHFQEELGEKKNNSKIDIMSVKYTYFEDGKKQKKNNFAFN